MVKATAGDPGILQQQKSQAFQAAERFESGVCNFATAECNSSRFVSSTRWTRPASVTRQLLTLSWRSEVMRQRSRSPSSVIVVSPSTSSSSCTRGARCLAPLSLISAVGRTSLRRCVNSVRGASRRPQAARLSNRGSAPWNPRRLQLPCSRSRGATRLSVRATLAWSRNRGRARVQSQIDFEQF